MKYLILFSAILLMISNARGQEWDQYRQFTRYDTLRGSLTPERSCYDVLYYELFLKVDPDKRHIAGYNKFKYVAMQDFRLLQFELSAELTIDSITSLSGTHAFRRDSLFVFVTYPYKVHKGMFGDFTVYYHGIPHEAKNPPWDGGFVWQLDENENHWVGVSCQGIGSSIWWPSKDHPSDEPDSMLISLVVPSTLTAVANGKLRAKSEVDSSYTRYDWFVSYPINNYCVTLNIADYAHFHDTYKNETSTLDLDYYVLRKNLAKARVHFKQVNQMLQCFEQYFGEYPFLNDGYKLVETSYWGMEHQSAVAYGNNYNNNLLGFDFIIIHESGHEWWGNSITADDNAELWIHESFTTYAEALYVECRYDLDRSIKYLKGKRGHITNKEPIIGPRDVHFNEWKYGGEMYYKGAQMLHTLRNVIDDDKIWFEILYEFSINYKRSIVDTKTFILFVNVKTGRSLDYFFNHYLRQPDIPIFEYRTRWRLNGFVLQYHWAGTADDFAMNIRVTKGKEGLGMIYPKPGWQFLKIKRVRQRDFKVDTDNFYIKTINLNKS